jgi:hypothetical protein
MIRLLRKLFPFSVVAMLISPVSSSESKPTIETLAWIGGCWEGTQQDRLVEEHWLKPAGQMLLGLSRAVAQGKTVAFEFLRIHQDEVGILYSAHPSGQKEASFRLKRMTAASVTFENPEHDFPQRIIYRKDTAGGLFARIEGTPDGRERGVDFPMKRVQCE